MDSEGNWSTLADAEGEQCATWSMRGELMLDKIGKFPDPMMITRRYGRT